ncbi:hypothetical protein DRN52_08465 [Thermococci archaeon]|nr:MAG: hypothetical protein DRN52_08465 [Thermococci archaeon]
MRLELNWGAIICIIIVVTAGILTYTGHISGEDFLKVVFTIVGLIGGGLIVAYYLTRKVREMVEVTNPKLEQYLKRIWERVDYKDWFSKKLECPTREDLTI